VTTSTRTIVAVGIRFIAVVPCLLALPVFLLAGWSLWAWALAAALLAFNILIALGFDLLGRGRPQVTAVGLSGVSLIVRAWLTFGTLFVIAWRVDRDVAVVAAGAFLIYFTVDMAGRSVSHVLLRDPRTASAPPSGGAA
jgi:hypothetical protein